jgi:eukaryotic translation initiation factor 2C
VTTRHLGYKRKSQIYRVETASARRTTFKCDEFGGGNISVETYFQKSKLVHLCHAYMFLTQISEYGIKLAHPDDLPVINIGKKERSVFIPAELCEIEAGQPYRGKLTEDETTQMLRYATHRPSVTADLIVNRGLPKLNMTSLPAFGVEINPEMTNGPARLRPPPRISYGKGNPNVRSGSWNIVDIKFNRAAAVQSWWVVVINDGRSMFQGPSDPSLQNLVKGFAQKLRNSGLSVPAALPKLIPITLPPPQQDPNRVQAVQLIRNKFQENLNTGSRPTFALVLLSRRDNFIYPGIKRIGDVECGVHTVHMLLTPNKKALDPDPGRQDQYFSNMWNQSYSGPELHAVVE